MKLFIVIILCLGLLGVQGCKKEKEEILSCNTNEEVIDGVCRVIVDPIDPIEVSLETALNEAAVLSNYQLDITIRQDYDTYDMILLFDGHKSSFTFDQKTDFYEVDQGMTYRYIPQGQLYVKEQVAQATTSEFLFFKAFQPEWFTYHNGKYFLNIQYQTHVQSFFETVFNQSVLSNFELIIENDSITSMAFDLVVGDTTYFLSMTIKHVGLTQVILPVV